MAKTLVEFKDVHTYFYTEAGTVKAVNGVSYKIKEGETVGVVGESGCGKTTLGKSILQLIKSTDGEMNYNFDGTVKNLRTLKKHELDNARKRLQIVFQDPHSSLNPAFTVFQSLEDPLKKFGVKKKQ